VRQDENAVKERLRAAIRQLASSQAAIYIGIEVRESDADDVRLWQLLETVEAADQPLNVEATMDVIAEALGVGTAPRIKSTAETPQLFGTLMLATAANCNMVALLTALATYALDDLGVMIRYDRNEDTHVWVSLDSSPPYHIDEAACGHLKGELRDYDDSWQFLVAA